jgi:hypothetical protein
VIDFHPGQGIFHMIVDREVMTVASLLGRSAVVASVLSGAGRSTDDLQWLKFGVITQRGDGLFYGVSHVQRINTLGGVIRGACQQAGAYRSAPYSADYVFWRVE